MKSKVRVANHPLHPILVGFPIAYYLASFVGYSSYALTGDTFWFKLGYLANITGVFMALLAAVPGVIDWLYATKKYTEERDVGFYHMAFNVAALVVFTANWWAVSGQWNEAAPDSFRAVFTTGLGMVATALGAYFGGELVYEYHVGLDVEKEEKKPKEKVDVKPSFSSPRVS